MLGRSNVGVRCSTRVKKQGRAFQGLERRPESLGLPQFDARRRKCTAGRLVETHAFAEELRAVASNEHHGSEHRIARHVASAQVCEPRDLVERCQEHRVRCIRLQRLAQNGELHPCVDAGALHGTNGRNDRARPFGPDLRMFLEDVAPEKFDPGRSKHGRHAIKSLVRNESRIDRDARPRG